MVAAFQKTAQRERQTEPRHQIQQVEPKRFAMHGNAVVTFHRLAPEPEAVNGHQQIIAVQHRLQGQLALPEQQGVDQCAEKSTGPSPNRLTDGKQDVAQTE